MFFGQAIDKGTEAYSLTTPGDASFFLASKIDPSEGASMQ